MSDAKELGELVLVLGDMAIPNRAGKIPPLFEEILTRNCAKYVLCTGNLCTKKIENWVGTLAPFVHQVKGDADNVDRKELGYEKKLRIGAFSIGLIHGHRVVPWGDQASLAAQQRRMGVDILVSGHTQQAEVVEYEGRWMLNPGSLTGAFSSNLTKTTPSFLMLAIKDDNLTVFQYKIIDKKVSVSKTEFAKKDPEAKAASK